MIPIFFLILVSYLIQLYRLIKNGRAFYWTLHGVFISESGLLTKVLVLIPWSLPLIFSFYLIGTEDVNTFVTFLSFYLTLLLMATNFEITYEPETLDTHTPQDVHGISTYPTKDSLRISDGNYITTQPASQTLFGFEAYVPTPIAQSVIQEFQSIKAHSISLGELNLTLSTENRSLLDRATKAEDTVTRVEAGAQELQRKLIQLRSLNSAGENEVPFDQMTDAELNKARQSRNQEIQSIDQIRAKRTSIRD